MAGTRMSFLNLDKGKSQRRNISRRTSVINLFSYGIDLIVFKLGEIIKSFNNSSFSEGVVGGGGEYSFFYETFNKKPTIGGGAKVDRIAYA